MSRPNVADWQYLGVDKITRRLEWNSGRKARKGHRCEDSLAYASYSSKDNTFPLWTTKLIWLRASHLLDAMKHDAMTLVLAIKQTPHFYQLNGEILQSIPNTPYLGVTISTDLKFNIHLNTNVAKSYQCLAFVRRNLNIVWRNCDVYSTLLWDDLNLNIPARSGTHTCTTTFTNWKLMVKRRVARFIKPDYRRRTNLTSNPGRTNSLA